MKKFVLLLIPLILVGCATSDCMIKIFSTQMLRDAKAIVADQLARIVGMLSIAIN
jgi:hypothetical protein